MRHKTREVAVKDLKIMAELTGKDFSEFKLPENLRAFAREALADDLVINPQINKNPANKNLTTKRGSHDT